MSNYELYLKFIEIASHNPLDGYCMLKDFKKEYKQSQFYKQTRMSLNKAYEYVTKTIFVQMYFKLQELTDISSWTAKINNFLEDLDEDKVQDFINKITKSFGSIEFEKGELQGLLEQMKSLV